MKTKLLILLATTITFAINANAQRINAGLTFGINGCQIDGDTQSGYNKAGIKAGFSVTTPTNKKLGIESGLFYTAKGATKKTNNYTEFKTKLNYIELPVIIKYRLLEKIGIDASVAYNQQISSKIIDEYGAEIKNPNYINKYDVTASAGIRFYISPKMELTTNFGYSIIKITNNPDMPYWHNNYINISITRRIFKQQ